MARFMVWAQEFAMSIGGPGIFAIAFLDSSVLSLPEINDILLVWMVTPRKTLMLYYVAMATLGSIAGCLTLNVVGRKGGEALLRRRFGTERVNRAFARFHGYGMVALIVPAILPPPAPFKVFVLMGGVARMSLKRFTIAIAIGRGTRYLVEGVLAVRYGDQAVEFVRRNGEAVTLALLLILLVGGVAYGFWYHRQSRSSLTRAGS